MKTITVRTCSQVEMVDITSEVRNAVAESGVSDGAAILFVPHTTAAVTINENADPDVHRDMVMEINKIVPWEDRYRHAEGNSAAHIKSTLVGASEWIVIENSRPVLGTWQGIYFCEFDGPRQRKLIIKVIGN
jgi:secondary thiamine-phosphate synthase enzyme